MKKLFLMLLLLSGISTAHAQQNTTEGATPRVMSNPRALFPGQAAPSGATDTGLAIEGSAGASVALNGRTLVSSLPAPRYEGNAEGRVVVEISVDARGSVTRTLYRAQGSTANDNALVAAALNAAKQARFNIDPSAPASQNGTITYVFKLADAPAPVASAPTNDQLIKIIEQSIWGNVDENLTTAGLQRFRVNSNPTPDNKYAAYDMNRLRTASYVDGANRIIEHASYGMPETGYGVDEISTCLIFTTYRDFTSTFAANGFKLQQPKQGADQNSFVFTKNISIILFEEPDEISITAAGTAHVMGDQCVIDVTFSYTSSF